MARTALWTLFSGKSWAKEGLGGGNSGLDPLQQVQHLAGGGEPAEGSNHVKSLGCISTSSQN